MTHIFMGPFFSWHSWGIYHLSGTLLSLGDIAINRVDKFRASMKLTLNEHTVIQCKNKFCMLYIT